MTVFQWFHLSSLSLKSESSSVVCLVHINIHQLIKVSIHVQMQNRHINVQSVWTFINNDTL